MSEAESRVDVQAFYEKLLQEKFIIQSHDQVSFSLIGAKAAKAEAN